jgi:hypothetical protein
MPILSEAMRARLGDPAFAPLRRSLEVYYGDAARDAAMDALYARVVEPGALAFDIGSHVGDRIGSFRRLGRGWWRWSPSRCAGHSHPLRATQV